MTIKQQQQGHRIRDQQAPARYEQQHQSERGMNMANNKKRWLTFEVYPDNPEQVKAFEWLKDSGTCSGMYINHKGEDGDKDHIHVMIYVDNPLNCKKQGDIMVCEGFAARFGTFDGCKTDTGFLYRSRGDELPEGMEWKSYPVFNVVQGVSDPQSLAWYFLHARYADRNKMRYEMTDLCYFGSGEDRFKRLYCTEDTNSISDFSKALNLAKECKTGQELLIKCAEIGAFDVVEYIRRNPSFVRDFMLSRPARD